MAIAPNISLVTITGEYVDYLGNPVAGQVTFRLPKTLMNALADQIVVQSSYSATLNAFGQFSITVPATDDPNFNETFQYTIIEGFAGGRTWQASLPGVDSFEDLQSRYVTFTGLSGSGQTFSDLVGVSTVKMSALVPAYTGGAFTELAAYQAYVVEEQAVTTQEGYISYAPAGVVLASTYGNVAFVYDTYTEVVADRATYALLISTPVVAETADILPLDDIRVNLLPNPSVETNVSYWNGNNGTGARSTVSALVGAASYRVTCNTTPSGGAGVFFWLNAGSGPGLPVTAGQTYTFSVYVRDTAATRGYRVSIEWRNSATTAGSLISISSGNLITATVNNWTRISITATAPANAQSAVPSCYVQSATTAGQLLYFDAALFEQSSTLGSYFDGSFEGFWTGTAHASTSRNATVPSYATYAQYWADLAIEQAEELFPHPFIFTGSLGVER